MTITLNNKFIAAGLFAGRTRSGSSLDEGQLRMLAPSIFATEKHESRSARFTIVPTWEVVTGLMREGFEPVSAIQGKSRIPGKADFTKHLIRFRHSTANMLGSSEASPEVLLMNAHDGTSSYRVMSGAFRGICRNGLVSAELIDDVKIGHTGNIVDRVIEGTWRVVQDVPKITQTVDHWQGITLSRDEQQVFAEASHELRYGDASEATKQAIKPDSLLIPHRSEDRAPDLWHVFNRVQENAVRGGVSGFAYSRDERGRPTSRRVTTRPIASIDGDTSLNRALWTLATKMAELKA
jgi:hypothetical protein